MINVELGEWSKYVIVVVIQKFLCGTNIRFVIVGLIDWLICWLIDWLPLLDNSAGVSSSENSVLLEMPMTKKHDYCIFNLYCSQDSTVGKRINSTTDSARWRRKIRWTHPWSRWTAGDSPAWLTSRIPSWSPILTLYDLFMKKSASSCFLPSSLFFAGRGSVRRRGSRGNHVASSRPHSLQGKNAHLSKSC